MKTNKLRWSGVLGLALVASVLGGIAVAAPSFTGDPDSLDWYVGDNASVDDPARTAAGLHLYDAAGAEVTSGSVNAPLPPFAAAGGTVRADDTFATLFVHAARSGSAAGAWPGVQATGTDKFSGEGAVSAPAALAGKPYVRTAGGSTLADAVATFPASGQGSYGGVFELRLRTSSPTKGVTDRYASAFVKVTGDQWSVVSGPVVTPPKAVTQTKAVAPAASYWGRAFAVTVTVTGAGGNGGTVVVRKGTTVLAAKALDADGVITLPVAGTRLAPGTHTLTVVYGGTAQTLSSQTTRAIKILPAPSVTVGKLSATTITRTTYPKITARVAATGVPVAYLTGTFTVYDGAKVLKRVTLKAANAGKLTVTLPRLAKGTHKIRVLYSGNGYVTRSASPYYTLIVK